MIVSLSLNSWHRKLQEFTFSSEVPVFHSLCPYFWLTVASVLLSPVAAVIRLLGLSGKTLNRLSPKTAERAVYLGKNAGYLFIGAWVLCAIGICVFAIFKLLLEAGWLKALMVLGGIIGGTAAIVAVVCLIVRYGPGLFERLAETILGRAVDRGLHFTKKKVGTGAIKVAEGIATGVGFFGGIYSMFMDKFCPAIDWKDADPAATSEHDPKYG